MKVLLTGATGFIGPALVRRLLDAGHTCTVVSRRPQQAREKVAAAAQVLGYDEMWPAVDAVVNMAGETLAGLWTAEKRQRVLRSRTEVTRRLVQWMADGPAPPRSLVSMSAIGIYGHRPGETLTEMSVPDPDHKFRARVTLAWEAEALAAEALGVRVALVRLANVLHPEGGYLGRLMTVYRLLPVVVGLGHGDHCFSWISRRDATRLMHFALEQERAAGPLNVSSPQPVARKRFSALLARALGKRAVGRVPDWLLKLTLGEFSSTIIDSQYVLPARAQALGFRFEDETLEQYFGRLEIG
ncbi:MAG TPA: TIGR01777 family oxidoreductase [Candidatus Sulfomarinibacteraceae bacterium]|nr:TIGR01777 family oxidoreductase [Candidatus Sulfomarinibacteraceae bacterium]